MDIQAAENLKPMPEQITYANLLFIGAWTSILLMLITYFIYANQLLPPHVDFNTITQNWEKGVDEYLQITKSPHGWGWVRLVHKSDFLNFLGLVFISVLTIFCYIFLAVGYKKRKDWAFFFISLCEIAVLGLAASGIFGSGGH